MQTDDAFLKNVPSPVRGPVCRDCRTENSPGAKFCEGCGLPVASYEYELLMRPAMLKARKWIGAVAILYLINGFVALAMYQSDSLIDRVAVFIVFFVLALIQSGIWWWAKRAVFAASIAALALYLMLILLNAIVDPISIIRGWLIKFLFIAALVEAIRAGLSVRRLQKNPTEMV